MGYVADPSCERGNAKLQYLFVNGRWVRDRSLAHAVQEGYRGLIMTGRYPVWFLFLELPPDAVDVNVHPTKAEVRFRDAQAVFHLLLAAVRDRLRRANLVPRLQVPKSDGTTGGGDGTTGRRDDGTTPAPWDGASAPTVATRPGHSSTAAASRSSSPSR